MFLNSLGGRIALNALYGNCAGILVTAEGGRPPPISGDVSIQLNQVTANNRLCPGRVRGAAVRRRRDRAHRGAEHRRRAQRRPGQRGADRQRIPGGGIVLLDGRPDAAAPTGNSIRLNRLSGNPPNDIYGDGTGTTNTISGNTCTATNLTGAC